jgi:hypothetical protein
MKILRSEYFLGDHNRIAAPHRDADRSQRFSLRDLSRWWWGGVIVAVWKRKLCGARLESEKSNCHFCSALLC